MSSSQQTSDEQLVKQAKSAMAGDARAFEALMRRHHSYVLTNCRYLSGSADDSKDLAQEVFVKTFFALSTFQGRSKFKTWLSTIKLNHCLNFLRKKQGKHFVDVHAPELEGNHALHQEAAAEKNVAATKLRSRVEEILDELPENLRIPVVLRDLDGMPYAEIAEQLGIGLSAVKMRIKRGRAEFRSLYDDAAMKPEN